MFTGFLSGTGVGSHIETHYKKWNIWVPAKDTGIDLLATNEKNTKAVSFQIKYSKDWTPTGRPSLHNTKLLASGWWSLQEKKIKASKADFWIFVLPSFTEQSINFVIVPPDELLRRFYAIFGKSKRFDSYLRVTKSGRCWEVRGLKIADLEMIAFDRFEENPQRDFTRFLNSSGWSEVEKRLR